MPPAVAAALRKLPAGPSAHLVLDLRRMSLVDCAALRVLRDARQQAGETGTQLRILCGAGQLVERLLAMPGTDTTIRAAERAAGSSPAGELAV